MHTSTTSRLTLPSLLSTSSRKFRDTRSPYPVTGKSTASAAPRHKAYSQLKTILSNLKPTKFVKNANRETMAGVVAHGDEGSLPSGQLALGHDDITQAPQGEASIYVPGGQLAPEHVKVVQDEPYKTTVHIDEYYGWAQVAKTSARFLSALLDCPETLPTTDPTEVNPDLAHFIAFALDRSRMPLCVHQYALHLIWRVQCLHPDFKPRHAHGTYLTALMLAAKLSLDIEYSIKCWVGVGQHIFEASQLRDNEWKMCERLEWEFLVHPMDLVKLTWTIEVEYGELMEGIPPSSAAHAESALGYSGMFAASVASSLSSLSTSSSYSLDSPWSGWGQATPSGSSISTPLSNGPICGSSPSRFS